MPTEGKVFANVDLPVSSFVGRGISAGGNSLATGGGAVISATNRQLMSGRGVVVYLNVPPHILWERTRHDRSRPLLQVADPRGRLQQLYVTRDPLYREVAHIIVEGGRGTPHAMVRMIEKELQTLCEH